MADENVVEKTETTPADTTKVNEEEKAPEKVVPEVSKEDTLKAQHKAELEELEQKHKAITGHKEDVIKAEKDKNKELKEELEGNMIDEEEINEKVKEAIDGQVDSLKKGFVSDAIEDEIDRISLSREETDLIKFHLKNSIKLSGTTRKEIRTAVEASKLLANKKQIMSTNTEMAEALKASATTRTAPDGTGEKIQAEEQSNLSAEEQSLLDKYDTAAKRHVEKAPVTNAK